MNRGFSLIELAVVQGTREVSWAEFDTAANGLAAQFLHLRVGRVLGRVVDRDAVVGDRHLAVEEGLVVVGILPAQRALHEAGIERPRVLQRRDRLRRVDDDARALSAPQRDDIITYAIPVNEFIRDSGMKWIRMGPATSNAWSRRTLAARSTYWRIDRLYHGTG